MLSSPFFSFQGYLNGVEELDLAKLTEMWGTFEGMYKPNGRDVCSVILYACNQSINTYLLQFKGVVRI